MLGKTVLLSIGGVLGVNLRHWLSTWLTPRASPDFPWPTLIVNVTGSFLAGLIVMILLRRWPSPDVRLFLVTGFLGGYTTFSSFSIEALRLWERGEVRLSLLYMGGSVALGFAAAALGAGRRLLAGPPA